MKFFAPRFSPLIQIQLLVNIKKKRDDEGKNSHNRLFFYHLLELFRFKMIEKKQPKTISYTITIIQYMILIQ